MLPRVNLVRADSADFLLFSTDDSISKTIYSTGSWASALLTISNMFYHSEEAPLILDIGANLGAYSIPIAKEIAESGGLVYSYEPQRIIYYQLCGNVFLNRLENVHAFNMAIGDRDGSVMIPSIDYSKSKNIGAFTLDQQGVAKNEAIAVKAGDRANTVPIARLDSLTFPKPPTLIKIDVEGLELQVLKGAVNYLEEHHFPPLLLEAWDEDWFKDRRVELLDYLTTIGYEYFAIRAEIVAQHPRFPRQVEFVGDHTSGVQMIRLR